MSENNKSFTKFIDIDKVISSKSEKLAKILPKFIINYLKRISHENTLNNHLETHKNLYGIDFIEASLRHFKVKMNIHGLENLKTDKKLLVASNHPLGGLDGLCLMYSVSKVKTDIIFPVNDLLMNLPHLKDLFIPINKHGTNPKDAVKLLEEMMKSEKTVLFFPAGLVSRKINKKIIDLDWKKTFVVKAKKHNRTIIPVFIDGANSNFFYNLAKLRKMLNIKTNIEMLYLVDEMYKQYNKEINVFFGEAISIEKSFPNLKDEEIANEIKSIAYKLPQNTNFKKEEILSIDFRNLN